MIIEEFFEDEKIKIVPIFIQETFNLYELNILVNHFKFSFMKPQEIHDFWKRRIQIRGGK